MSDSLDKFVLQYTVEMKDAIKRLEQLGDKVEKTNKSAKKASGEFKEFAKGATDELSKVVPGIDKINEAVKAMGAEFAVAASAIAALAIGITSVMNLRSQMNKQRLEGMDVGVSDLRIEEYQRKMARHTHGRVTREQTSESVKAFADSIATAYADPTRLGKDARIFKMMGIDIGARGQGSIPVNKAMVELSEAFRRLDPSEVQGIAKSIGMNQDFALALRQIGPEIGKVTELTKAEIEKRKEYEKAVDKLNDSIARLKEQFIEAENVLGGKLIGHMTEFVNLLTKIAAIVPSATDALQAVTPHKTSSYAVAATGSPLAAPLEATANVADVVASKITSARDSVGKEVDSTWGSGLIGKVIAYFRSKNKEQPQPSAKEKPAQEATGRKVIPDATAVVEKADENNQKGAQVANDMTLAVNMFQGAVTSFANAIDEKQAWAAWAGELGHAAGLGSGPQNGRGIAPNLAYNADTGSMDKLPADYGKYTEIFEKASRKFGVSVELLQRVAMTESHFNRYAQSPQGARGLMQIMPDNFKNLGITDPNDPMQNIMGGAKLLSENIKMAGGDIRRGLMIYHGGTDTRNWGPKTLSYPGKVLNDSLLPSNTKLGESRATMNLKAVQDNIAAGLGLRDVRQLQMGGINRGDVIWKTAQLDAGIQNNIADLERQLQNVALPQQTRSKIMNDILEQQRGLASLRQYAPDVISRAQEGDRSITRNEQPIVINVNGAGNPVVSAQEIARHLNAHWADMAHHYNDGMKY